ncbi:YcnI family copper-binding membrane protein [Okibacterium fritillariae]|uniref:Uncharacterized protein YcnI n=1 Tax=Okibacterium fritillariae TaxID=123320 RepID=A0A1T5KTS8_9MICO|nr:YcnI family protein [Okibacterium fritillariae]SKC67107.1 Uncharacterized protein YcnI [Okibacterium fritillariae]
MKKRTPLLAVGSLTAGVALALAAPLAASAHVSVTPSDTAAGSYTVLSFAVGHGCDGSPTTKLSFDIPEEIVAVTPTVTPNWDIEKQMTDLKNPITDSHGESLAERVGTVVYTAKTPLADGYRDTVSFQVQLPEDAAGKTLSFPVVQTCEQGQTDWTQVAEDGQDPEELESPAPQVTVTEAQAAGAHGHSDADGDEDASAASASSENAAATTEAGPDVVARTLGILGIVVGAAGVVTAVVATRRRTQKG